MSRSFEEVAREFFSSLLGARRADNASSDLIRIISERIVSLVSWLLPAGARPRPRHAPASPTTLRQPCSFARVETLPAPRANQTRAAARGDAERADADRRLADTEDDRERANAQAKSSLAEKIGLEAELETLRRSHDEEMGEMVDAVNDLKLKEDELRELQKDFEDASFAMERLSKEISQLKQEHAENVATLKDNHGKEIRALNDKLDGQHGQMTYLKESLAGAKVESDLQRGKFSKEKEMEVDTLKNELGKKEAVLKKYKDELANKEEELEFVKEELNAKIEDLQDAVTDMEVKEAGFNNSITDNKELHESEIEVLVTKVEEAKAESSSLAETLARTKAEDDSRIDELLIGRKTEVNTLQDLVSERDRSIVDVRAQLRDMKDALRAAETQAASEAKMLTAKLEKLTRDGDGIREQRCQLESTVKTLQTDFELVSHKNEDLQIILVEKERQVKEVTQQAQSLKVSFEKHQQEMSERMERTLAATAEAHELQSAVDGERRRVDELQVALGDVESERDKLQEQLRSFGVVRMRVGQLEENEAELLKNIEDLRQKEEFIEAEFETERQEFNDVVQRSKTLLQEKMEEFKAVKARTEALATENLQLNGYKRTLLMLEQDKRELENQIVTLTVAARNAKSPSPAIKRLSAGGDGGAFSDEGDDFMRGQIQIDFLKSVIVDMQRKNDELKAKLDLYEAAGILDDDTKAAVYLDGVSSRQIAPRLFCDICDAFDVHDTEDCPTQASEDLQLENEAHTRTSKRSKPVVRPYCENCEVFGHDTQDCDAEETF